MRAHILKNGIVINTIEVESLSFMPNLIDASIGGKIGDKYIDGQFVPVSSLPVVPQSITPRQCRLQLLTMDVLDDVEAALSQMGRAAQIEWEFANEVLRDNVLVDGIQQLLGKTDTEMDEFFIDASKL
jgi:hypothetical protein